MHALTRILHPKICSEIGYAILVYDNWDDACKLLDSLTNDAVVKPIYPNELSIDESLQRLDGNNSDICAIFLGEDFVSDGRSSFELLKEIQDIKSNIPIFMRLTGTHTAADLPGDILSSISGNYKSTDLEHSKSIAWNFLAGFYLPNKIVQIFNESGAFTLRQFVKNCQVNTTGTYLSYDHSVATEFTSILPIQLPFGNGVVTFSISEEDTLQLIKNEQTSLGKSQTSSSFCNQLISEIINQFWGRSRQLCENTFGNAANKKIVNIPIVVNPKLKYIDFGRRTPQLRFRYEMASNDRPHAPILVEFKLIFNSLLEPKNFRKIASSKNKLLGDDVHFELF